MDKEDFVTYKQALALKKLGFDDECFYNYQRKYYTNLEDDVISEIVLTYKDGNYKTSTDAPTLAQVQKWLIEQGLFVEVFFNHFNSTWASSIDNLKTKEYIELKDCATYEEALSIGITQCLKLLENE